MRRVLLVMVATVTAGVGLSIGVPTLAGALRSESTSVQAANTSRIDVQSQWSTTIPGPAGGITMSSPNVANLPGGPAVVVGDESGYVDAYSMSNGAQVAGWPYHAGPPIDSTPSVAPTQGGSLDSVFVGVGNQVNPFIGGYYGISPQGGTQWFQNANNPSTDTQQPVNGVRASLAVGNLQGQTDVAGGSMGQNFYAMNATTGSVLSGFPWFQADSSFATPALSDLYGNGQTDIIEGNDSTAGSAYKTQYFDGGSLRIVSPNGNTGQQWPNGGLICQYNTDQVVQSSPAVGDFLANAQPGIVVGFGSYYQGASATNQLIAIDPDCNLQWAETLDNNTVSSPVVAGVLGNGQLQVVENTGSKIWVLNGSNGQPIWSTPISSAGGSPATADLSGNGYQDIIVNTYSGTEILDGRSGQIVTTLSGGGGSSDNSPLVTNDANGTIGITVAGGSEITHYEVSGSNGSLVNEAGAWPMFHHDPQLTGNEGAPPIPNLQVPCSAPRGPIGYDMTGSDGGIFTFGNLPFCGSTGAITLNQPVVGMALTANAGGYWTVARDGGLFAFGNAKFYGSMGGKPLNAPIVGMAATRDGAGYWEVASDGGLFAFGDAKFYGSMGGQPLDQPIVGMAATRDGAGYWEVASDGGLFAFGDAKFHGSMGGQPLDQPIVGMAATRDGGGYWEVASDGGLFAFGDATFYGSMGGQSLNKPIVGMAATPDGAGYWEVASDGGFFAFGDAKFYGSMGGQPLNKPIVGMAAT
jgi:hypothetical protein